MLEDLVNQNLFIERVGSRPAWYRYHHLFAEILRTELVQDAPAEVQELHARAAALVPRQGGEPRRRPARIRGRRSRACVVVPRRVVVRPPERGGSDGAGGADRTRFGPSSCAGSIPLTAAAATLALMNGEVRRGGQWLDAACPDDLDDLDERVQAMFLFACGPPLPIGRPMLARRPKPRRPCSSWPMPGSSAGRTADRVRALTLAPLGICELWLERPSAHRHLHEALHLAQGRRRLARPRSPVSEASRCSSSDKGGSAMRNIWRGAPPTPRRAAASNGRRRPPWGTRARPDRLRMERPGRRRRPRDACWPRSAARSGDRIARALSACVDASLCLARGDGQIEIGLQRLEGVASDWSTVEAPALRADVREPPFPARRRRGRSRSGPGDARAGARRDAGRLRSPPRSGAPPPLCR